MLFATVSEVAGLWKLALICAVVVLALLFQKQIRGVLDRGFRVRHRDTEIEAAPSAPIAPLGTGEEAEPEQPNQEAERVRDEGEGLELDHEGASPEDDADPTISSVIALLIGGEFEKAREVFDAVQAAEADATTRLQNQATFALARVRWANDADAVKELEGLTENPAAATYAWMGLAMTREWSGHFDNALQAFEEAEHTAGDDEERRAVAIAGEARCLQHLNRTAEAISRLRKGLAELTDDDDRVFLYITAADLYERDKEWLGRALALEKALETRAYDKSLRFRAGYSYAHAGFDDVALLHYLAALDVDPKDSSSRNNSGVAYERLDMPMKSVAAYTKAEELGNTLASANLAQRLINAGLADEAEEKLHAAAKAEDPHPNVGAAISRLAEHREAESERQSEVLDRARLKERFFRDYGTAFYVQSDVTVATGTWRLVSSGAEATVAVSDGQVTIEWTVGTDRHIAKGRLLNRSIPLTEEVTGVTPRPTSKGYGVVDESGRSMSLLLGPQGEEQVVRLSAG